MVRLMETYMYSEPIAGEADYSVIENDKKNLRLLVTANFCSGSATTRINNKFIHVIANYFIVLVLVALMTPRCQGTGGVIQRDNCVISETVRHTRY